MLLIDQYLEKRASDDAYLEKMAAIGEQYLEKLAVAYEAGDELSDDELDLLDEMRKEAAVNPKAFRKVWNPMVTQAKKAGREIATSPWVNPASIPAGGAHQVGNKLQKAFNNPLAKNQAKAGWSISESPGYKRMMNNS